MFQRLGTAIFLVLLATVGSASAHAGKIALLLEQPYGHLGAMDPLGHVSIYLSDVCVQTPVRLRRCDPGERGAVLSRYHHIDGYDWLAMPLLAYLYAVNDPADIPAVASKSLAIQMRNQYRLQHLINYVPDDPDREIPKGDWTQLLGESYLRTIYGFSLHTTPAQDDALIAMLNDSENRTRYNLAFRNCANFVEDILNFYFPHSVHRNFIADLGFMTPKQAAHSLEKYAKQHPKLKFSTFVIPQVPGRIARSGSVHGILDSVLESKKYLLPLAILQPYVAGGLAALYLGGGLFHPGSHMKAVFNPRQDFEPGVTLATSKPSPSNPDALEAQQRTTAETEILLQPEAGLPSR